jgi:hypothetical protein
MSAIWSWKFYNPHENKSQIINAFGQNRSKIKQFWKPEWAGVSEAMLKWFKQESSDNLPVSGPLCVITFAFPKI